MNRIYLVTGATGHLGTALLDELDRREARVRALVLPGEEALLPGHTEACVGDVTDADSLERFIRIGPGTEATLIHCAGMVSIASEADPRLWRVNVIGTKNVMAAARHCGTDRVIYVSSVHAIPEREDGGIITEISEFSAENVKGHYAKSKAEAARIAMCFADEGLNVSVVHPSGIIGPGDRFGRNHMIRTIKAMAKGRITVSLDGGFDFVDSRDVALGILGCAEKGARGECYILSGSYISIKDLLDRVRKFTGKKPAKAAIPFGIVKAVAPAWEKLSIAFGKRMPIFTPYSIETLNSNSRFSHEKATRTFGYSPRPIDGSIAASL